VVTGSRLLGQAKAASCSCWARRRQQVAGPGAGSAVRWAGRRQCSPLGRAQAVQWLGQAQAVQWLGQAQAVGREARRRL
jgi:hypothetical protein